MPIASHRSVVFSPLRAQRVKYSRPYDDGQLGHLPAQGLALLGLGEAAHDSFSSVSLVASSVEPVETTASTSPAATWCADRDEVADDPVGGCADRVLHLHRLEHQHGLSRGDLGALLDGYADHGARHRRQQRAAPPRRRPGRRSGAPRADARTRVRRRRTQTLTHRTLPRLASARVRDLEARRDAVHLEHHLGRRRGEHHDRPDRSRRSRRGRRTTRRRARSRRVREDRALRLGDHVAPGDRDAGLHARPSRSRSASATAAARSTCGSGVAARAGLDDGGAVEEVGARPRRRGSPSSAQDSRPAGRGW